jgi:ketosteroid isomerase-like protein
MSSNEPKIPFLSPARTLVRLSVVPAKRKWGRPKDRSNESRKGELVRLVISQSGDMAEEFGNFTLSFDQPDKTHIGFDGSYLRVWRKINGEWLEDAYFARPNEPEEKKKSGS